MPSIPRASTSTAPAAVQSPSAPVATSSAATVGGSVDRARCLAGTLDALYTKMAAAAEQMGGVGAGNESLEYVTVIAECTAAIKALQAL